MTTSKPKFERSFIGNARAWHLKYNAWYKQCADTLTAWVGTKNSKRAKNDNLRLKKIRIKK